MNEMIRKRQDDPPPTSVRPTSIPPSIPPTSAVQSGGGGGVTTGGGGGSPPTTGGPAPNPPTTGPGSPPGGGGTPTVPPTPGSSAPPVDPGGGGGGQSSTPGGGGGGGNTSAPPGGGNSVPNSSGGTVAPPVTSSAISLSTPTMVSAFSTNYVSTAAGGQVQTVFFTSTAIVTGTPVPVDAGNNNSSNRSSNTASIVGGVVGGIGGLLVLGMILFFVLRWKRKHDDDFDGNFDPDRVVRHSGHIDLAHEDGPAVSQVTPFPFANVGNNSVAPGMPPQRSTLTDASSGQALLGASTGAPSSHGRQLSAGTISAYAPTNTSDPNDARSDSSAYPPSTIPSQMGSYYYQQGQGAPGAGAAAAAAGNIPLPPPSSTSGGTESWVQQRPTKEREARLRVNNDVLQHTDGGRIAQPGDEEAAGPSEVPPSYDSIPDNR